MLLVLALVAYPFGYAIYLSMTRKYVGVPPVWVGLDNYVKLTWDGFFQRAVVNSFIFTFGSVSVKLALGVAMALVLTSRIRFRSFFTGVLLIPWVAPTVVSALNFLWIFDYSLGVLNYLLVRVFRLLPQGVGWLSEANTAMASVIAVKYSLMSAVSSVGERPSESVVNPRMSQKSIVRVFSCPPSESRSGWLASSSMTSGIR